MMKSSFLLVLTYFRFKISTFILTYLAYTCYHMSRKPISVVKSVLQGNCTNESLQGTSSGATFLLNNSGIVHFTGSTFGPELNISRDCGYAPFGNKYVFI